MTHVTNRFVLAFSGDLASAAAIPWLARERGAEVVTVTVDIGDGLELDEVRGRALALGATRAHVLDAREEFANDCLVPALRTGAPPGPDGDWLAALAAPLVARKVAEIAAIEHGTPIVDPCREFGLTAATIGGIARAYGLAAPKPPRRAARAAGRADSAALVEIAFAEGVPHAINGIPMRVTELIESLATIAGEHGIGAGAETVYGRAAVVLHAVCAHAETAAATRTVRVKLFNGACDVEGATLAQV